MGKIEFHPADPERTKRMEQFKKDLDYFDAHYDEWVAAYPDQWVVVYEEKLVGAVKTVDEVRELVEREGIVGRGVKKYLKSEPYRLIV